MRVANLTPINPARLTRVDAPPFDKGPLAPPDTGGPGEAETFARVMQQQKEPIRAVFRIDGKIAAAQYVNGWLHMERDGDLALSLAERLPRAEREDTRAMGAALEGALRQKYGNRLTVETISTGLKMRRSRPG